MSHPLIQILKTHFRALASVYVESFADATWKYGEDDAHEHRITQYTSVITDNFPDIFRMAAGDMAVYLNSYDIHINQSADEFKLIYFLGRAIERYLKGKGLLAVAQIHMYLMIGLLDDRLRTRGYDKPPLSRAMGKLIRLNEFDSELGKHGCYLLYKCVSTSKPRGE